MIIEWLANAGGDVVFVVRFNKRPNLGLMQPSTRYSYILFMLCSLFVDYLIKSFTLRSFSYNLENLEAF